MHSTIPTLRITSANAAPVHRAREYVLYWMIAARRTRSNFALDRAIEWAKELGKPLVVFEPLRVGYEWASDRLHHFVLDGMADSAAAFEGTPVTYFPYIEEREGDGSGLLAALSARACVVVTDEFPCFFLPRMVGAAASLLDVRLEAVDSNGLVPLRAPDRTYQRAFDFRRWCQKNIVNHLDDRPAPTPLLGLSLPRLSALDAAITTRWPVKPALLAADRDLSALPIDHTVRRASVSGGAVAAHKTLDRFVVMGLGRYLDRNQPDERAASELSPYLHFGHISAHDVFAAVAEATRWSRDKMSTKVTGSAQGFWGMSEPADSFIDELITWREVGYLYSFREPDYDRFESLPEWARTTLKAHQHERREHVYDLEAFEGARTYDPIWNAAQRELVRDGRMHNYLRMLWGKKVLEWSRTPEEAFATLIHLNNKYALDGRNPNSYSGIAWCFGRFDRPWPERPIFGVVRSMSSDSTRKKIALDAYLRTFGKPL